MTQIVSSISGLPIYAPSAAFAPTNGSDVSAIASAYAESAASGKQDSGSYLSSTDASAFYPSTSNPSGYLTALPADLVYSAELSSYAYESSNSAKLDTTAFSTVSSNFLTAETVTATAGDGTYVTSINGMGLSGQGGGGAQVVTATGSALVSSPLTGNSYYISSINGSGIYSARYARSAEVAGEAPTNSAEVSAIASAYQVVSAVGDDGVYITSINGSALSGAGGGGATGSYVETSATEVTIGSSNSAVNYSFTQGAKNTASSNSLAQGWGNFASGDSFAQGESNYASGYSFAQGYSSKAKTISFAQGMFNSAYADSFAQGYNNTASQYSFAQGQGNSAINTAAVFGKYNLHGDGNVSTGDSAAFAIGDGTAYDARHDLMLVTKDGEITTYSSTSDTAGFPFRSAILAVSAAATGGGGGGVVTATAGADGYVTSINGSGISGAGGGGGATGDYVETSAIDVTIGGNNTASSTSFAQGSANTAYSASLAQGIYNSASSYTFAQGGHNSARGTSFAQGSYNYVSSTSFVQGSYNSARGTSFAQGSYNYASGVSFAQGYCNSAINTAVVFGTYNLCGNGASTGNNVAFVIGDGTSTANRHDLMRVTKDGEITMFSSTADTAGFPLVSTVRSLNSGMEISAGPGISLNVVGGVLVISTAAI